MKPRGLAADDPRARALAEATAEARGLEDRLGRIRSAQRVLVREALAAGASFRWIASHSGLTLGAVQRLAGSTAEAPQRAPLTEGGSGGEFVGVVVVDSPRCVRAGCGAVALEGKRLCGPHHSTW
jgi:hypothetical protein